MGTTFDPPDQETMMEAHQDRQGDVMMLHQDHRGCSQVDGCLLANPLRQHISPARYEDETYGFRYDLP